MASMTKITLRLSSVQLAQIKKLTDKLQIDQTNIIRLAISELAAKHDIVIPTRR